MARRPARGGRLRAAVGTVLAPVELVALCIRRQTWHAIVGAAETLAQQWRGGVVVETSHTAADGMAGGGAPTLTLRTLIQLDGEVMLTVDRAQMALFEAAAPGQLDQALARHGEAIAAAMLPLRQGLLNIASLLILARRSRWPVLGIGGLGQGGAIALAPSLAAADSVHGWLVLAAGHPEVVLVQALALGSLVLSGTMRMLFRSLIRGRLNKRLPALLDRFAREDLAAAHRAFQA